MYEPVAKVTRPMVDAAVSRPPAPDQAERDRVTDDLDATLFVEAGAGSGKTTALVDRVLALVASGIELRTVAAITFTEKAGAELRAGDIDRRPLGGTCPPYCTFQPICRLERAIGLPAPEGENGSDSE